MDRTGNQVVYKGAGLASRAYSIGRIALILVVVTIAWYFVAEFLLWGDARTRGEQPPAIAWFAFLALALGTLIAGIVGLITGVIGRVRTTSPAHQRLALTGVGLSVVALIVLIGFIAGALTVIEG